MQTESARGLWALGKYWIDYHNPKEPGGNLYRYWYDATTGANRRRSLGTEDFEQAQQALALIVSQSDRRQPAAGNVVLLLSVLDHYLEHHAPTVRSAGMASRAARLVVEFLETRPDLGTNCTADAFSLTAQNAFVTYCHRTYGHSVGHLTRIMGVLAAAVNFSARPILLPDADGNESEVKLLAYPTTVLTDKTAIAKLIDAPAAAPVERVLSMQEVASFLDTIQCENTFRYCIMALNTWARPEAITDLRVSTQVDFAARLIDMLPPGRRQNNKRRPKLKLTENLAGWLEHWGDDAPMHWRGKPIVSSRKGFEKAVWRAAMLSRRYTDRQIKRAIADPATRQAAVESAKSAGFPKIDRYGLRHFMATQVQGLKLSTGEYVPREQRRIWLGHRNSDTTDIYEHHGPEYLAACAKATDAILARLDDMTARSLFAPAQELPRQTRHFEIIQGGK